MATVRPNGNPGGADRSGGDSLPLLPDQRERSVTVVVCDHQPVFARGLARLLQEENSDLLVAGIAVSMSDAKRLIRQTVPDVALIGLMSGSVREMEEVRELCSVSPDAKVLLLTPEVEAPIACGALAETGVAGYVLKERDVSEIAEVVKLIARGHLVMPAAVVGPSSDARPGLHSLNDMEREILKGVALGETNRELAVRLHLSERTVSRRLEDIYSKLHLADRLQAAVYAATHGLVTPWDLASSRQDKTL